MTLRPIGVGVLGLGFMGRTHLSAYRAAAAAGHPNRIVALCDADAARFEEGASDAGNLNTATEAPLFDPAATACHTDLDAFLAEPELELVSICTHTDTHVELAERALAAGKHVLVEKPVALEVGAIRRLVQAEEASAGFCMPAMCMRFWPGWDWLRATIQARSYGGVREVHFRRLSARPGWAQEFYADPTRSGGALHDLHVHDADLVLWMFGTPRAVSSEGERDHVKTSYDFGAGGPLVSAEGLWDPTPDFPFHMGYEALFDDGRAEYVLGREAPLVLRTDTEERAIPVEAGNGYEGEVRHALAACATGTRPAPTLGQALTLAALLAAEGRSLASGKPESPRAEA